ncbi:metal-dependent amidase/aminoacylase/carboxypeptidase [Brachybacterium phenoliresistens]|uniref:Metal-dependent amidase/aminoacylase/carboxypeptidase n=1 Tax=Brachybacterium phenoliresistens TaxID=396014 RepID=Z9JWI6_9MICO|nr:M20/M25/M40 family metallo-hydrolase [Brachybacterium phenoliresistens]EWS82383.1 metal-dependent amidase/aminoacylase/carboxypeptidase [Brachybacterium phenoliresistens]
MSFESIYPEVRALVDGLWDHPELGYREERTSRAVEEFLHRHGDGLRVERFSTTGLKVALPSAAGASPAVPGGDPAAAPRRRIAVVAELDAVISPAHPDADPTTGAVHACGHHTQVGIALAAFAQLVATGAWKQADVDLTFVFVPAEEFVDLAHRARLREEGTITWFGGKPEAMMLGVFDDVDAAVCLHAIGGLQEEPTIEIDCDLAGFLYKTVEFEGVASHAGLDPFSGTNAYAMATLFTTALGLGRQQLREDVLVRMNPVIPSTEMTTNVVPHRAVVGTDVRSIDLDYLGEVASRVDRAAHGCAAALGGTAHVRTEMGYLPFVQDRTMSGAFREAFAEDPTITRLIEDRGAIAAAGDAGDLSFMMPTVQLSYGGFDGTIHGRDFRMVDPEHVLIAVPRLLVAALLRLGAHLPEPLPRRTYAEYVETIAAIAPVPEGAAPAAAADAPSPAAPGAPVPTSPSEAR